MKKKDVEKFRNAFKSFWLRKMAWRIDRGHLDNDIEKFLNGDKLEINMKIELLANDIIFMRQLVEMPEDLRVFDKVEKKWEKGE